ncbi:hypothetical protein [Spirosoma aerophilum]
MAKADRSAIQANGEDLAFVTVKIVDKNGLMVPDAAHAVNFSIQGAGEIVATDNGDPANLVSFASRERQAYNGRVLAILRAKKGTPGKMMLTIKAAGLQTTQLEILTN